MSRVDLMRLTLSQLERVRAVTLKCGQIAGQVLTPAGLRPGLMVTMATEHRLREIDEVIERKKNGRTLWGEDWEMPDRPHFEIQFHGTIVTTPHPMCAYITDV